MSAQPIQDFYDGMKEVDQARADWDLAKKRGDDREMDETGQKDLAFATLSETRETLSTIRGVIDGVNNDKTMTTDDKRQLIDQNIETMILVAKGGLAAIDDFKTPQ